MKKIYFEITVDSKGTPREYTLMGPQGGHAYFTVNMTPKIQNRQIIAIKVSA